MILCPYIRDQLTHEYLSIYLSICVCVCVCACLVYACESAFKNTIPTSPHPLINVFPGRWEKQQHVVQTPIIPAAPSTIAALSAPLPLHALRHLTPNPNTINTHPLSHAICHISFDPRDQHPSLNLHLSHPFHPDSLYHLHQPIS